MSRRIFACFAAAMLALTLGACGAPAEEQKVEENVSETVEVVEDTVAEPEPEPEPTPAVAPIGTVDKYLAEDEDALIGTYAGAFSQQEYTDGDTGLTVTYNLYLPAGYDASSSYPLVVFIADMSCTGGDASRSLTQGRGALVWVSEAWQSVHPSIVCVPTYPVTILDDHGSYTTTEYVELTKRLIDSVASDYAVDTDRIYGTGQSMGCMTTLILASEYPDLYSACMFVDGQWDVNVLSGLKGQRFVYFAAADDENASAGMAEVMGMFDADGTPYTYVTWDGTWSPDELSAGATDLFAAGTDANFITWASGTIDASSGGMGGSAAYHMASFDYAYRCIAVMEWLFQQ